MGSRGGTHHHVWKTFINNLVGSGGALSAQCDVNGNSRVLSKMEDNV